MSDGDTTSGGGDDELRLGLYRLLHERAETERKWRFWRLAAGHLVVGVVVAFAVLSGRPAVVALTPIVYGVVVMDALRSGVRSLYIQQQLAELEAKLAPREPLFNWVRAYGVFGPQQRMEVEEVDLNAIPEVGQYLLVAGIYLGLVLASLLAWRPLDGAGPSGIRVTRSLLLVGYATFSVLFAVIVAVGYLHYRRVGERIAALSEDPT
ncbi:MAG: hypothetical protein ABEJ23_01010 [Haloarculaceae archaeon]